MVVQTNITILQSVLLEREYHSPTQKKQIFFIFNPAGVSVAVTSLTTRGWYGMVVWWYHTILRWYHTAWSSFSLVYYHHHIIWRWFADGPPQPCQYHHHMEKERHGHGDGPSDAAVASAIDNNFSLEEETTAKRTDLEICHEPPLSNEMTPTTNILTFRQHLTEIVQLTIPIIFSEIFQNTLPIIDLAFVGRLSKDDLAAAALATVWFNLWNATLMGFGTALDTLLAQAYGAAQYNVFAMWTGNGLLIFMVATVVMAGLMMLCEPVMRWLGQDKTLAHEAGRFAFRLVPGLFPYFAFKVLTKHLQTQDILLPGVVIGVLANVFNIFANWFLIHGLDMGLDGAPWATSLTRAAELLLIAAYFAWKRKTLLAKTWPVFSSSRLWQNDGKLLKGFLQLAGSGALALTAEAWSFEISTVLAGLLGTVELDAHIITLSIATFCYLSFPFAIAIATTIRIGHLIGDGRDKDAKRSSFASFCLTGIVQASLILIVWPSSAALGKLFSNDEDVSDLVAKLLPLSCVFMMADSIQSTAGGVLRGLGRQRLVLILNVIGFWILAVPFGATLTFAADVGVKGLVS